MTDLIRTGKNRIHQINAWVAATFYRYPAQKLHVIGVTGTDGKTTTSTILYHMLKKAGFKVALVSTVAAFIRESKIDTGFHVTSPSPWQLQRLMRKIVNQNLTHLVLEATSHGLDQHRLDSTNIAVAIVTNITHEHLDYHKTYQNYVKAKAKIFKHAKHIILNKNDKSYTYLKQYITKDHQTHLYSIDENTLTDQLSDAEFNYLKKEISQKFPETYNQENALATFVGTSIIGMTVDQFVSALPSFEGVEGRMQPIKNSRGLIAIVDFAHTPNALEKALTAARQKTKGKVIVVFGAAGLRDESKRPLMGEIAANLADEIILTAEDPRGEDVSVIIQEIKSGATKNRGHIHGITDRRDAIRFAVSLAHKGDVVILCGKGHEKSMNLDGRHEIPWSDKQTLKIELESTPSNQ